MVSVLSLLSFASPVVAPTSCFKLIFAATSLPVATATAFTASAFSIFRLEVLYSGTPSTNNQPDFLSRDFTNHSLLLSRPGTELRQCSGSPGTTTQ